MVPVVQKELGLKDEEAARKLFYSNTFDFTGMGPLLVKRLMKLQSSIGFYEVQTGQSVRTECVCTQLMPKLAWLESAIANGSGIDSLKVEPAGWLMNRQITLSDSVADSPCSKPAGSASSALWLVIIQTMLSRLKKKSEVTVTQVPLLAPGFPQL